MHPQSAGDAAEPLRAERELCWWISTAHEAKSDKVSRPCGPDGQTRVDGKLGSEFAIDSPDTRDARRSARSLDQREPSVWSKCACAVRRKPLGLQDQALGATRVGSGCLNLHAWLYATGALLLPGLLPELINGAEPAHSLPRAVEAWSCLIRRTARTSAILSVSGIRHFKEICAVECRFL